MTAGRAGPNGGRGGPVAAGFLGLGSNIGDRLAHLRAAVAALPAHGVRVLKSSSVYETEPVGLMPDQRDFFNACISVLTPHEPDELLDVCKTVERQLGRGAPVVRHGPREIDIDVLLLDRLEYRSERLVLPHPQIAERRFVLVPLLELDPGLTLPDGRSLPDLLAALGPGQAVRRVSGPLA